MKLNLACGKDYKVGYVNVDVSPSCGADKIVNLFEFPYPFEDNSADEIICHHFVEHIPHQLLDPRTGKMYPKDGLIMFMEECYRILKPGAQMGLRWPYPFSESAIGDPTHCRYCSLTTFHYFSKDWMSKNGALSHYGINADYKIVGGDMALYPGFEKATQQEKEMIVNSRINVVFDSGVIMEAVK